MGEDRIDPFNLEVLTGSQLVRIGDSLRGIGIRRCVDDILRYIRRNGVCIRVLLIQGLEGTSDHIIEQTAMMLTEDELDRTAIIRIHTGDSMKELCIDMDELQRRKCCYVLIENATEMDDFIGQCAVLADIYAASGFRIIISGHDSFMFELASYDQLFDRCIQLHTTFIPFCEYERLGGRGGIYGFTGCLINNGDDIDYYLENAVVGNIVRSIGQCNNPPLERHTWDLMNSGLLEYAISCVLEDLNRRFVSDCLFQLNGPDYGSKVQHSELENMSVIDGEARKRILYLLELVDFIRTVHVIDMRGEPDSFDRTILTQPYIRFAQAFSTVCGCTENVRERREVLEKIRAEVEREMVILEIAEAFPKRMNRTLILSSGIVDVISYDDESMTCRLYIVDDDVDFEMPAVLMDPESCNLIKHSFGEITDKVVIHRGGTRDEGAIRFVNIEEFLRGLGKTDCSSPGFPSSQHRSPHLSPLE